MKEKIFIIFVLILHTSAKLTDNDDLLCKFVKNPFDHRYFLDNYQSIEQRDILIWEKIQQNFQYDMLNAHNILRKQHCVPPLILDDKISENAQAYAEYLAKQDNRLIHSDRKDLLGENLYTKITSYSITNPDADEVTRSWYHEIINYNFNIPGHNHNTGHFTQIVWKDTKKLGIGIAFAREGRKMYFVTQYSPPGNDRHAFSTNVFPAKC